MRKILSSPYNLNHAPSLGLTAQLRGPAYTDAGGNIGNFDPSVPLSGRAIYPDGKQSVLAQNFLASANACNPDGINNTHRKLEPGPHEHCPTQSTAIAE